MSEYIQKWTGMAFQFFKINGVKDSKQTKMVKMQANCGLSSKMRLTTVPQISYHQRKLENRIVSHGSTEGPFID